MRRRSKGPKRYEEWDAALSRPLDYENAEYLSCGTLGQKELYAPLFNRISDFVTGDFNRNRVMPSGEAGGTESVYALKKFTARLKLLMFYKKLDFLKEADKNALTGSLETATKAALESLKARFGGDDPDMGYEIYALERAFKTDKE